MKIDAKSSGIGGVIGATLVAIGAFALQFLSDENRAEVMARGIVHYCALAPDARNNFRVAILRELQKQGKTELNPSLCGDETDGQ